MFYERTLKENVHKQSYFLKLMLGVKVIFLRWFFKKKKYKGKLYYEEKILIRLLSSFLFCKKENTNFFAFLQ